jgi:hypothetical protein
VIERGGTDIRRLVRRRLHQATRSVRSQQKGPGKKPSTLLVIDPLDPPRLTACCNRRWSRVAARLFATSLDHRLAQGRSSESNRLMAAQAQVLVSPAVRSALAQDWETILIRARRPRRMRDPRVGLNRDGIIACESDIHLMVKALLTPLPIPARGVAMASRLLSDGTGPLFNRHCSADLGFALRSAIAQLDPSTSLI